MSKYILIYDALTRMMGIIDLIFICKASIPPQNFGGYKYLYGPYITVLGIFGDKDNTHDCYQTNNILVLNESPIRDKFIINRNGEIFATPTSKLMEFFYLEKKDADYDNFSDEFDDNIIYYKPGINLFSKCIRAVFLIKKKYNLPRPIAHLIILKLCSLHFNNTDKYYCSNCEEFKGNKLCSTCYSCDICGTTVANIMCYTCKNSICFDTEHEKFCGYCNRD